jgi:aspartokinase/homoserine dehydrogenase 1
MQTIVMKFGGTSVAGAERIAGVADIVRDFFAGKLPHATEPGRRLVIVVSAFSGVTDALFQAARSAAQRDEQTFRQVAQGLRQRHWTAIDALIPFGDRQASLRAEVEALVSGLENLCRAITILGELTPRGLDAVVSLGERLSARVAAAALSERGVPAQAMDATNLVVTDDCFGEATPLMDATREKSRAVLLPLIEQNIVPVVTGFLGATADGVTSTLGRGGSDYSGAILGSCLDSDEIWVWTDVNGVLTADPRVVPDAHTLPRISYNEAAELAYFGGKVLHPKTMLPAMERNIPIRILNTFEPQHPGTLVVAGNPPGAVPGNGHLVKAITTIRDLSIVTVEGRGMMGVPGIAAKVFSAVAQESISVLMISQASSEQSICFVIRQADAARAIAALKRTFELELARHNVDRIWAQDGVAIVAVVGAGMRGTPGIGAKVFGALGQRSINVISVAQGSSEYNISLVVTRDDALNAVKVIHQEFDL